MLIIRTYCFFSEQEEQFAPVMSGKSFNVEVKQNCRTGESKIIVFIIIFQRK